VSAGADVDAKDALGRTALMLAEKDNHNDIAQELIRNQASVFAKDEHGRTPLHYAAMSNFPGPLIDTLLASGAAVTARDDDGYTAKELAVRSRDMFKNRSRSWYDKL
jgi:ankyrin repeat protein